MPSTCYLVTGGARSGKSSYAEKLCLSLSGSSKPIYLATARAWDDDFKERIARHQKDRGGDSTWVTIEEQLELSQHADKFSGKVILVDCLTLWLTNYMVEEGAFAETIPKNDKSQSSTEKDNSEAVANFERAAAENALEKVKKEFDNLIKQWDATFVFVTNEIGSGTHASDNMTRKFVDCQGWLNQHVATVADRVIHMVSGVPNVIKEPAAVDKRNPLPLPSQEKRSEAKMLDKVLSTRSLTMDKKGYFLVKIDRRSSSSGVIVANFMSCMTNDKGEVCDLQGNKIKCKSFSLTSFHSSSLNKISHLLPFSLLIRYPCISQAEVMVVIKVIVPNQ